MNSKTYHQTAKDISKKLNDFFMKFCQDYPQYELIKEEYTKKPIHLNGVQFYAGFVSGPFENWQDYQEVAVAIEVAMLWAYKTKFILDRKQETWEKEENLQQEVLQHDLMVACIHDLLDAYAKKERRAPDKVRTLVNEMLAKLSYGFWVEKTKLNIKKDGEMGVLGKWDEYYIARNNSLNLVYDYAPLIGFALSSGNFDIIKEYLNAVPNNLRFSHASQIISDLGNFGEDLDKNAKSNLDPFSDMRGSIMTFSVYKLLGTEEGAVEIRKALEDPELIDDKQWRKTICRLIAEGGITSQAMQIAAESYDAHKKFFESYLSDPSQMLMRIFGMLINNKYFDQKIVFAESPLLRSRVVLCDKKGNEKGTYDKLKAYKESKMHKTFSIFIYNSNGEHLMRKISDNADDSKGKWTNAFSSHCISGEKLLVSAKRILKEELGIECELEKRFSFAYKVDRDDGLSENVFDTVLLGKFDGEAKPNNDNTSEVRWMEMGALMGDLNLNPRTYTDAFKKIMQRMGYR